MFVTSYPPFRPGLLWTNAHLQTVFSHFMRRRERRLATVRWLVTLPDGDRIVIHDDQPDNWITGDRIAILVHGLGGSHASPYMRRTADKLTRSGIRAIRVDLRGVGDATLLSRGHAHAGASADVGAVIKAVQLLSPISKITLLGFSLGGNLVLRLAGEWGESPSSSVDSVIAVAPPVDLLYSSANLRQWGNRGYDWFFVQKLIKQLAFRRRHVTGLLDNGLKKMPDRLIHFDDQFVAPVNGYSGARDYYRRSSSAPVLRDISLSTLIIAAKDDPVVPVEMFSHWVLSPSTELLTTTHGGHLGFLSGTHHDPDPHWLDWRLSQWISEVDCM